MIIHYNITYIFTLYIRYENTLKCTKMEQLHQGRHRETVNTTSTIIRVQRDNIINNHHHHRECFEDRTRIQISPT